MLAVARKAGLFVLRLLNARARQVLLMCPACLLWPSLPLKQVTVPVLARTPKAHPMTRQGAKSIPTLTSMKHTLTPRRYRRCARVRSHHCRNRLSCPADRRSRRHTAPPLLLPLPSDITRAAGRSSACVRGRACHPHPLHYHSRRCPRRRHSNLCQQQQRLRPPSRVRANPHSPRSLLASRQRRTPVRRAWCRQQHRWQQGCLRRQRLGRQVRHRHRPCPDKARTAEQSLQPPASARQS